MQSVCGSRLRSRGRWNVHRAGTDARCEMLTLLRCAALAAELSFCIRSRQGIRSSSLDCALHDRLEPPQWRVCYAYASSSVIHTNHWLVLREHPSMRCSAHITAHKAPRSGESIELDLDACSPDARCLERCSGAVEGLLAPLCCGWST